jgi:hypothetical protein
MNLHKEISFETEICEHLAKHGWLYAEGDAANAHGSKLHPQKMKLVKGKLKARPSHPPSRLPHAHNSPVIPA